MTASASQAAFLDEVPLGPAERAIGQRLAADHEAGRVWRDPVPLDEQIRCAEWADAIAAALGDTSAAREIAECRRVVVEVVRGGVVVARTRRHCRRDRLCLASAYLGARHRAVRPARYLDGHPDLVAVAARVDPLPRVQAEAYVRALANRRQNDPSARRAIVAGDVLLLGVGGRVETVLLLVGRDEGEIRHVVLDVARRQRAGVSLRAPTRDRIVDVYLRQVEVMRDLGPGGVAEVEAGRPRHWRSVRTIGRWSALSAPAPQAPPPTGARCASTAPSVRLDLHGDGRASAASACRAEPQAERDRSHDTSCLGSPTDQTRCIVTTGSPGGPPQAGAGASRTPGSPADASRGRKVVRARSCDRVDEGARDDGTVEPWQVETRRRRRQEGR